MKKFLAVLALPLFAACPGSPRPNNWIDPAAVRQPFLNIVERHDWYIRQGFQPPVLENGAWVLGPPLSELEKSTYLNESAILKQIILDNSGTTNPVPLQQ